MFKQMLRRIVFQERNHLDKSCQEVEVILRDGFGKGEEAVCKGISDPFRDACKILALEHHINLFPFFCLSQLLFHKIISFSRRCWFLLPHRRLLPLLWRSLHKLRQGLVDHRLRSNMCVHEIQWLRLNEDTIRGRRNAFGFSFLCILFVRSKSRWCLTSLLTSSTTMPVMCWPTSLADIIGFCVVHIMIKL